MSDLMFNMFTVFAMLFVDNLVWFFLLVFFCLWLCNSRYHKGKRVPESYYVIHHSGKNFLLLAWISLFFAAHAWFVVEIPGYHVFGNFFIFASCACMYGYGLQDSIMRRGPSRLTL